MNEEGYHIDSIEGHWRQMKAKLPKYGRKKGTLLVLLDRIRMAVNSPWREPMESLF